MQSNQMNVNYFLNMERHIQETDEIDENTVYRRMGRKIITGKEIDKIEVCLNPHRLGSMIDGAIQKYERTTNDILNRIQNAKRKGITKYQTLGHKQAYEIQKWCEQNNIECSIVYDEHITRKKLSNIDIWFEKSGKRFDYYDDFSNEHINYTYKRQKVVYIQIKK
jgi:hypothetical protein